MAEELRRFRARSQPPTESALHQAAADASSARRTFRRSPRTVAAAAVLVVGAIVGIGVAFGSQGGNDEVAEPTTSMTTVLTASTVLTEGTEVPTRDLAEYVGRTSIVVVGRVTGVDVGRRVDPASQDGATTTSIRIDALDIEVERAVVGDVSTAEPLAVPVEGAVVASDGQPTAAIVPYVQGLETWDALVGRSGIVFLSQSSLGAGWAISSSMGFLPIEDGVVGTFAGDSVLPYVEGLVGLPVDEAVEVIGAAAGR